MNQIAYGALVAGVALAGFMLMLAAVRKIPADHRGVVFRFGRLQGELSPGTVWVVPFIDQVMLVDLREQTFALPPNLTYASRDGGAQYRVEGEFTCKVVAPIPAVMAAMQARQDVVDVVAGKLLNEIKQMGHALVIDQPAPAQARALAALNEQMSRAWQLRFTGLKLTLVPM